VYYVAATQVSFQWLPHIAWMHLLCLYCMTLLSIDVKQLLDKQLLKPSQGLLCSHNYLQFSAVLLRRLPAVKQCEYFSCSSAVGPRLVTGTTQLLN
jgi:hypothetical protein